MKGKLIVCEGLDCSGKTTTIKEILDEDSRFIYSKGIGSDALIGKISRKFPSTFIFFTELIYSVFMHIKPNLKKGRILLQDRYDISITSYVPLVGRMYNKFIIKIFKMFIVEPDAVIYFYLPLDERIKRLREKGAKYELMLADNPDLILIREEEYLKWYNKFKGSKIKINTQENNLQKTAGLLLKFVLNLIENQKICSDNY